MAIALVLGLWLLTIGPLKFVLDHDFWLNHLQVAPCCVVGLFLLLFTVLTVVGIPGTILVMTGGIIFGFSWGVFWSTLGATSGALGAFWAARYLFREGIERRWGNHPLLAKFKRWVLMKPFLFVLVVRFSPISPFNVVNYLLGLTPLHWLPYAIATFVGIIPGTLVYTWLGVSGKAVLVGGDRWPFFLAMGVLGLLSTTPFWLKKYLNKAAMLSPYSHR